MKKIIQIKINQKKNNKPKQIDHVALVKYGNTEITDILPVNLGKKINK